MKFIKIKIEIVVNAIKGTDNKLLAGGAVVIVSTILGIVYGVYRELHIWGIL